MIEVIDVSSMLAAELKEALCQYARSHRSAAI